MPKVVASIWTRDGTLDFLEIKFAHNLNIICIMRIFAKNISDLHGLKKIRYTHAKKSEWQTLTWTHKSGVPPLLVSSTEELSLEDKFQFCKIS